MSGSTTITLEIEDQDFGRTVDSKLMKRVAEQAKEIERLKQEVARLRVYVDTFPDVTKRFRLDVIRHVRDLMDSAGEVIEVLERGQWDELIRFYENSDEVTKKQNA